MKLVPVEEHVSVPRNTGIAGFLRTLETLLQLSHLQQVTIESTGDVYYKRYAAEGERSPLQIDFSTLQPHHVIRAGEVTEVNPQGAPHITIFQLLRLAAVDRLSVVGWALGSLDAFVRWGAAGQLEVINDTLLGWPLHVDRALDTHALVLCCSHQNTRRLIDCHRFYKIDLSLPPPAPVEVFP